MDVKNVILKLAVTNDAEELAALINSVYRGENSKKGWTTEADFLGGIRITPQKIAEIISGKNDIIIKAIYNNGLIGCVHLENTGKYSYFGMLSIDVNYQAKGAAKILMNECERITKNEWGLNEIRLKVISRRRELIEYYERRGFLITGEKEEFGSKMETFGDPKETLWFETMVKKL